MVTREFWPGCFSRGESMLSVFEGRGFLVRHAYDGPLTGVLSMRRLALEPTGDPFRVFGPLAEVLRALPAGLDLLWDVPLEIRGDVTRRTFMSALAAFPGLRLHFNIEEAKGDFFDWVGKNADVWFHSKAFPEGELGALWRQGLVGWVPEESAAWSLPGYGRVAGDQPDGVSETLWGELVLPLGALGQVDNGELDNGELALSLASIQAQLERDFSQRMAAGAWPVIFPFQRRRAGWRVALLGGREYMACSGSWESAASRCRSLLEVLRERLKCPVWVGTCHDFPLASTLGHLAMRDAVPWRSSLPLPPASPAFSPGLGADPREAVSLEARLVYPPSFAGLLAHPPLALLRVPLVPEESAVAAFLRGQVNIPAIRWITPEVPPPGPFSSERPWAPMGAYAPLMDVTQASQPGLFDDEL